MGAEHVYEGDLNPEDKEMGTMTMDKFRIDSHKIEWHRDRLARWLEAEKAGDWELAKKVYPIYVEIAPVGGCNHRCSFCAVDYIGYQAENKLERELLFRVLAEMAASGVKSVMWAGEGEPLIHKQLAEVIAAAKSFGIDSSITTNAVLLTEQFAREALPHTTWIKASVNGGGADSYRKIHKARPSDWDLVWLNLRNAVKVRAELGATTALGVQSLLLPEVWGEVVGLARRAQDTGLDYIVIKPYSQHSYSNTHQYEEVRYQERERLLELESELKPLNDEHFSVVFRRAAIENYAQGGHQYEKCLATPNFWAYLMADGDLYGCSAYLKENLKDGVLDTSKEDRFNYGNIRTASFQEVWEGERRKKSWEFVRNGLDISECRINCRMNQVNKHLDRLKSEGELGSEPEGPAPEHINFI